MAAAAHADSVPSELGLERGADETGDIAAATVEVVDELFLLLGRLHCLLQVLTELVTRQDEVGEGVEGGIARHDRRRVVRPEGVIDGLGDALREREPCPVREFEVRATILVGLGIVVLDEGSGAAHQMLTHQAFPVVRILRFTEGLHRGDLAVDFVDEPGVSRHRVGRGDTEVVILVDVEQESLRSSVSPGGSRKCTELVVRMG